VLDLYGMVPDMAYPGRSRERFVSTYVQLELPLGPLSSGKTSGAGYWSAGSPQYLQAEALRAARFFLGSLTDPKRTPRVPRAVRAEARALLARYPSKGDLEAMVNLLVDANHQRVSPRVSPKAALSNPLAAKAFEE